MDEYDSVMNRLKSELKVFLNKDVAELIGMSAAAYSNRNKSRSVPYEQIISTSQQRNIDLQYIFTGVRKDESPLVKEPSANYQTTQEIMSKDSKLPLQTSIGSRLKEERKGIGDSQESFGLIGGVTKKTQGKYESDEARPNADYLAAIAEIVDVLYVITGERLTKRQTPASILDARMVNSDNASQQVSQIAKKHFDRLLTEIEALHGWADIDNIRNMRTATHRLFHYAKAAANDMPDIALVDVFDSDTQQLAYNRELLQQFDVENLSAIYMSGTSMQPSLFDEDIVIVDRAQTEVFHEVKTFAFQINDELLVKSLQRLPGDRIQIWSKNLDYPPYIMSADDLTVVGRVVCSTHIDS